MQSGYDKYSLANASGLYLWHIVEDRNALDPSHPPPTTDHPELWPQRRIDYPWAAGGNQNWGRLKSTPVSLTWADGSSVGATVTLASSNTCTGGSAPIAVSITRP